MVSRRSFIGGSLATAGAAFLPRSVWSSTVPSDAFPRWRAGELELHFIYTGCGENCFYILPDGTTILNDTGDFYRPENLRDIPLLPSAERLGGEWVTRYISRIWPEKAIDYLIFSHWHTDHVGAMDVGQKPSPRAGWRYRDFGDGMNANGVAWNGADGRHDYAAEHVKVAKGGRISQNALSSAFVIRYGRFSYYAGQPFLRNVPEETRHGVHVAVKVAPGGGECAMYLMDARDESMRVVRRIGLPV